MNAEEKKNKILDEIAMERYGRKYNNCCWIEQGVIRDIYEKRGKK